MAGLKMDWMIGFHGGLGGMLVTGIIFEMNSKDWAAFGNESRVWICCLIYINDCT